ncbi:DUF2207 family protein [Amycolatopsis anabasis]|uniref:DUF2207 family protein n=1 Tax=Amycolatopsis anabasis TaxID=1840409 RepID=UPI00131D0B37|nr:DUF2207 domain-containing protein [Amycolatopsis anabasis]
MRRLVLPAVLVLIGLLAPPGAAAQDQPPVPGLPQSAEIALKLERDGALSVTEAVSVPEGTRMNRRVPLRLPAGNDRDRVLSVRDIAIEGRGDAQVAEDAFTVRLDGGTALVRYTVDGVVGDVDGLPTVRWRIAGGWDTPLNLVRGSFAAPKIPRTVRCAAGPEGGERTCDAAQFDHAGLTRFTQQNLAAGDRMDLTVELPGGTVPANERLEPADTVAGAFLLTAPVAWTWGGFAVLLLAGLLVALWLRQRDARPGAPLPVDELAADGVFASPEGVLPGQVGAVLSGRAGTLDLAATVLDLAVRNYLWVAPVPGELPDWTLTRRNPADDQLTGYERIVFETLFAGGDSITLSGLRAAGGIDLAAVRDPLHDELVRRRWFARRGRWLRAGVRVACWGVFLTVLLALTVGYAQLGLVVLAAGGALALGGRLLPARTERGRILRRRLLGLHDRLRAPRVRGVGKPERELVFSRGLPYALVLGEAPAWIAAFGELKRPPAVYWYALGEHENGDELAGAGEFAALLPGAISGTRPRVRTSP